MQYWQWSATTQQPQAPQPRDMVSTRLSYDESFHGLGLEFYLSPKEEDVLYHPSHVPNFGSDPESVTKSSLTAPDAYETN
jgi:hypothetical protein